MFIWSILHIFKQAKWPLHSGKFRLQLSCNSISYDCYWYLLPWYTQTRTAVVWKPFSSNLKSNGWVLSSTDVFYPDLGDTITGSCHLIIAIHSSCASTVNPPLLKWPSSVPTLPIGEFIWKPFNWPEHAISLDCNDADFDKQDMRLKLSTLKSTPNNDRSVIIKYSIHCPDFELQKHCVGQVRGDISWWALSSIECLYQFEHLLNLFWTQV